MVCFLHTDYLQNTDENGHGSHVAGTVGGATFGMAKTVNLVAVKVLDADGAGSNSGVISGLNFGSSILTSMYFIILTPSSGRKCNSERSGRKNCHEHVD